MADLEGINKAIVKGKRNEVVDLVKAAVDEGVDPQALGGARDGLVIEDARSYD